MDYIVHAYAGYHNMFRPHQRMGNQPLSHADQKVDEPPPDGNGLILQKQLLGGLLNHYY